MPSHSDIDERLRRLRRDYGDRLDRLEQRVRALRSNIFIDEFSPGGKDDGAVFDWMDFLEIAVPANPDAGWRRVFANTATNKMSVRTSGGTTINLEYGDAEAIAAVEGEATLDLTGEVTIASGKSLTLKTDGSTGGAKFGAAGDVVLYRGAANRLDLGTGDSLEIVLGNVNVGGDITLTGTVDGVDIAARDHAQAHGAGDHTEHGNWKVVYTDGSGDEIELALGAAGTYLRAAGAAAAPTMSAILDGDVPATHSGSAHHAILTINADGAHSLNVQELAAVLAANGQTGHMSGAMFDKLDGVEALADVTDAANVAGAGAVMDSDISPAEGFLRKTGAGAYTAHKSNLAAAAAPGVNDDTAAGYSVGSVWVDTTNDDVYVCVDATNGAAIWPQLDAAAAAHALLDGATHSDSVADAVTRGSLIYGNASTPSKWDELVIGPANTILGCTGLEPAWTGSPSIGGTMSIDTIAELTSGAGVTVDGLPIKDGTVDYGDAMADSFWHYTDLLSQCSRDVDSLLGQAVSGAGSQWVDSVAVAGHQGVWRGNTGSTATGHARLFTQVDGIIFSNGKLRFGALVQTRANLSTAAQRYQIYAGIIDNHPLPAQEGVMFFYRDDINGGNWLCRVINGGGLSDLDSGVAVAASTWYLLEFEVNVAGNSVEFFVNGSSVGTTASGPAANATAELRVGIQKTVGTSNRLVNVDAVYVAGDGMTRY